VRTSTRIWTLAAVTALVGAPGSSPLTAQDKYAVGVPGGLGFAEFRGSESWQLISLSEGNNLVAVILGNSVAVEAYAKGIPGNGQPFPDGARLAKIHWTPEQSAPAPGQRRHLRLRVPLDREVERLRLHGVRIALSDPRHVARHGAGCQKLRDTEQGVRNCTTRKHGSTE
jgi:hypothetical protein